ncbi:MAG TPA: sulfur oxidation c-type cytochrome SoxX [Casimicrobiaceae bacterium]|nr:sulfur oxidation c-type cytochrome SoxX [Casimicrobiaceae bacterium]
MIPTSARVPQSCMGGAAQPSMRSIGNIVFGLALVAGPASAADPAPGAIVSYRVVGDGIPQPLASGDPARGKALVAARDPANCVLCHEVPDPNMPFAGNVGPPLAGVAARLSVPQLRLRVVDNLRVNPQTIMPSYYRLVDLNSVAAAYQNKTILTAPQVEDVVAYLATLR